MRTLTRTRQRCHRCGGERVTLASPHTLDDGDATTWPHGRRGVSGGCGDGHAFGFDPTGGSPRAVAPWLPALDWGREVTVVLGGADPEMGTIERLARHFGMPVVQATCQGKPVHAGNAYRADPLVGNLLWVECAPPGGWAHADHHRAGDHGFGAAPEWFWDAGSLGQFLQMAVDSWTPLDLVDLPSGLTAEDLRGMAAADHCLRAAYAGACPGVTPESLRRMRVGQKAAQQGTSREAIEASIERAIQALREATAIEGLADLRGVHVPELPEAQAISGIGFVATIDDPDGRTKVVVQSGDSGTLRRFLAGEILPELVGRYGDPVRGFAGAYLP
ncbi:MAG: hypothetical protein KIS66_02655 [Fimbriimonadaceae bacterium]|nr:hypothetical protein [Fimbriimonadaceae bacterium]